MILARAYVFGHKVIYDGELEMWLYEDSGFPICDDEDRACPRCGRMPLPGGEDPCLGHIDGISAACCGHGVAYRYLMKYDGTILEDF